MKVKKYTGPTMPQVMNEIRKELGPEAVILNSKEIQHGGIFGFLKKKRIEVVAALDPDPLPINQDKRNNAINQSVPSTDIDTTAVVLQEVKHLKKMVALQSQGEKENYQPDYQIAYQYLLDQEVDHRYAEDIINAVVKKQESNGIEPDMKQILRTIKEEINTRLSGLAFEGITKDNKIVHFVGPTGVGKTTTLAKIAANSMLKHHKRVAFITADTYRIAAIEQLKTYAQILDVPMEVVYTNEDYQDAIQQFAEYDLILVDTAGRNFRDAQYVAELEKGLGTGQEHATYLVLSLTAKPKDLTEIYQQFYHVPIKGLIFTKVDETRQYGSMINIVLDNQIGISYLTNGQDVPDDLSHASPGIISDLIVGGYDHE
ncbi:flagellar biosynthesis protein FlhF [Virgibacillus halotolerans]|uniref:flagellar biosynthesis protein FlhF n=1 Tax=Virgibacillus halotolerans TaxID=1071053 RepID=UPI00195FE27E|nr:flagellar biosynthesis protein FlhF [Virgibacillus halotolerans]MBM7598577.1 flagellar biosynthesis protein FlhF [Virgibacillus halotolerans]